MSCTASFPAGIPFLGHCECVGEPQTDITYPNYSGFTKVSMMILEMPKAGFPAGCYYNTGSGFFNIFERYRTAQHVDAVENHTTHAILRRTRNITKGWDGSISIQEVSVDAGFQAEWNYWLFIVSPQAAVSYEIESATRGSKIWTSGGVEKARATRTLTGLISDTEWWNQCKLSFSHAEWITQFEPAWNVAGQYKRYLNILANGDPDPVTSGGYSLSQKAYAELTYFKKAFTSQWPDRHYAEGTEYGHFGGDLPWLRMAACAGQMLMGGSPPSPVDVCIEDFSNTNLMAFPALFAGVGGYNSLGCYEPFRGNSGVRLLPVPSSPVQGTSLLRIYHLAGEPAPNCCNATAQAPFWI